MTRFFADVLISTKPMYALLFGSSMTPFFPIFICDELSNVIPENNMTPVLTSNVANPKLSENAIMTLS